MNFKPLLDRVVIKRIAEENRTAGGMIIPDTAKEKPSQGVVTAVAEGTANVTATFGGLVATCAVTVKPVPVATEIVLNKTDAEVMVGKTME